jgi:hypothetical protein
MSLYIFKYIPNKYIGTGLTMPHACLKTEPGFPSVVVQKNAIFKQSFEIYSLLNEGCYLLDQTSYIINSNSI